MLFQVVPSAWSALLPFLANGITSQRKPSLIPPPSAELNALPLCFLNKSGFAFLQCLSQAFHQLHYKVITSDLKLDEK